MKTTDNWYEDAGVWHKFRPFDTDLHGQIYVNRLTHLQPEEPEEPEPEEPEE